MSEYFQTQGTADAGILIKNTKCWWVRQHFWEIWIGDGSGQGLSIPHTISVYYIGFLPNPNDVLAVN